MQNKSNSLRSRRAPTPFSPGMKLSMKNNVRSSRNKISGTCLTLDFESKGLSVLSAPRWQRYHQLFLLTSNRLTENTQTHSSSCHLFYVEGRDLFTYTSSCFSKSFITKQGNQKEMKQCSLHTITVCKQKKINTAKISSQYFLELYLNYNVYAFLTQWQKMKVGSFCQIQICWCLCSRLC